MSLNFMIEEESGLQVILADGRRIAFYCPRYRGLDFFGWRQKWTEGLDDPPPDMLCFDTTRGAMLSHFFGAYRLDAARDLSQTLALEDGVPTLRLERSDAASGEWSRTTLRVHHAPERGFFVRGLAERRSRSNGPVEFLNVYPVNAGESRSDRKRYSCTVTEVARGDARYRPHNHITTTNLDHFNPPWQDKNLAIGGLNAFLGEPDAPAVRILSANGQTLVTTCDAWYDEHHYAHGPAEPDADGFHDYRVEFEVFRLDDATAGRLLSESRSFPMTEAALRPVPRVDTTWGSLNRLDRSIDPCKPDVASYFPVHQTEDLQVPAAWELGVLREQPGWRVGSIRLFGRRPGDRVEIPLLGCVLCTDRGARYEIRAKIRSRGLDGKAFLCLHDHPVRHGAVVHHVMDSVPVTGTAGWTAVAVQLEVSPECLSHPLLALVLEGEGTAWFGDVEFVKL